MAAASGSTQQSGFLLRPSPSAADIYDQASGRALLVPGFPLTPPPPKRDAVRIGIIDSGVISAHPQLKPLVVAERAFAGSDPLDRIGHGTLVALQAVRSHADPQTRQLLGDRFSYPAILSARVTDDAGVPTVEAVIAAIEWVASEGAKVVNLSLGFRGKAGEFAVLCEAITRHGEVFFAAAAGNFGPDVPVYPAVCRADNLMAVGEVRDGSVPDGSGTGDIYAPSEMPLVTPWQYHYENGLAAANASDYQQARAELALSLGHEANAPALFQLALLAIHEGDLPAAHEHLQRARDLEPQLATLHTHLGAVQYMRGQYVDAVEHLRQALAIDSQDETALFNLGQALLQIRQPAEALAAFQRLRDLNPEYPRIGAAIAFAQEHLEDRP